MTGLPERVPALPCQSERTLLRASSRQARRFNRKGVVDASQARGQSRKGKVVLWRIDIPGGVFESTGLAGTDALSGSDYHGANASGPRET